MQTLNKKKARFIVLSLIIPLTLLICFVVFPAGDLIRMSFTNWDGYSSSSDFIGFDNYISMFQNKDLWTSLRNNGVYFAAHLLFYSHRADGSSNADIKNESSKGI